MLQSHRVWTGLPPRAESASILDTDVYSVRLKSPAQSFFNDNVVAAVSNTDSLSPLQALKQSDRREAHQSPNSSGSKSSTALQDSKEFTIPYPSVLKALPPKRIAVSRVKNGHPEQESVLPSHNVVPRISYDSSRKMEQGLEPSLTSSHGPMLMHASQNQYHNSSMTLTTAISNDASGFNRDEPSVRRVPSVNPFIPRIKTKTASVPLIFEDSDGSDENTVTPSVAAKPELTVEEKMHLEVMQEQLHHLCEAIKSKKVAGAVKIKLGMDSFQLLAHLDVNHADISSSLSDLQGALYKLAWDYHTLFFEGESFQFLLDYSVDGRCKSASKLALQVILVLFERDARVNGGMVRLELFDSLYDIIADRLSIDDDEFEREWGLWFVS
jgi:hypothetical protein